MCRVARTVAVAAVAAAAAVVAADTVVAVAAGSMAGTPIRDLAAALASEWSLVAEENTRVSDCFSSLCYRSVLITGVDGSALKDRLLEEA